MLWVAGLPVNVAPVVAGEPVPFLQAMPIPDVDPRTRLFDAPEVRLTVEHVLAWSAPFPPGRTSESLWASERTFFIAMTSPGSPQS